MEKSNPTASTSLKIKKENAIRFRNPLPSSGTNSGNPKFVINREPSSHSYLNIQSEKLDQSGVN